MIPHYRRPRRTGRPRKPLSQRLRRRILIRDKFICGGCGKLHSADSLEVHHIVPVSKGGTSEAKNLLTLCVSCHIDLHGRKKPSPEVQALQRLVEELI